MKIKNSNGDQTKKKLILWPNKKYLIGTKLKIVSKTQQLKMWKTPILTTQIVTNLKNYHVTTQIVPKFKNSNCDKSKTCDKTQKLKLWQNSKTLIGTNFKRFFLVRHPDNRWDVLWAVFCDSRNVLLLLHIQTRLDYG